MRRDPAEEGECRGWFLVAVRAMLLSTLAKAVVISERGGKGGGKEGRWRLEMRCEFAICRKDVRVTLQQCQLARDGRHLCSSVTRCNFQLNIADTGQRVSDVSSIKTCICVRRVTHTRRPGGYTRVEHWMRGDKGRIGRLRWGSDARAV